MPSQGPPKGPPPELFKRFLSDAQQLSEICGFDTDDPFLKKVVAGHKESLRAKDPTARNQAAAHRRARASGRTIKAKSRAEGSVLKCESRSVRTRAEGSVQRCESRRVARICVRGSRQWRRWKREASRLL